MCKLKELVRINSLDRSKEYIIQQYATTAHIESTERSRDAVPTVFFLAPYDEALRVTERNDYVYFSLRTSRRSAISSPTQVEQYDPYTIDNDEILPVNGFRLVR